MNKNSFDEDRLNVLKLAKYQSRLSAGYPAHANTYKAKINEYSIKLARSGYDVNGIKLKLQRGGDRELDQLMAELQTQAIASDELTASLADKSVSRVAEVGRVTESSEKFAETVEMLLVRLAEAKAELVSARASGDAGATEIARLTDTVNTLREELQRASTEADAKIQIASDDLNNLKIAVTRMRSALTASTLQQRALSDRLAERDGVITRIRDEVDTAATAAAAAAATAAAATV